MRYHSAMATLEPQKMSLLEQLGRKISCWSAGVLLIENGQVDFSAEKFQETRSMLTISIRLVLYARQEHEKTHR